MARKRENFSGKVAFVMALAGSAIGLGNIWRFPYMVGEHGGAAFILVYIFCSIFLSLPLLFTESIIGRRAAQATYGAMETLSPGTSWKWVGLLSGVTCFIILSYYSVVGGWSIDYLFRAAVSGFDYGSVESSSSVFASMSSSIPEPLAFFTAFLAATSIIVLLGIKKGIEKFSKITIPVLFVLIVLLAVYSLTLPGASEGVRYLVTPDFSKLSPSMFAYAMGQSFYSMSLGVGCVLTYSSYMKKEENIATTGILTSIFDTLFALIAAFAVMPAVFAANLEPGAGPSLIFETLPYIFAKMGADSPFVGRSVMIIFFLSVLMAALTSSISMMEVCVSNLMERKKMSRKAATALTFAGAFILGSLCSLSFGSLGEIKLFGLNIFSFCDTFASNYLMTFGALAFSIFVGWKMGRADVRDEFTNGGTVNVRLFNVVYFLIKWISPLVILAIFVSNFIL